MTRNGGSSGMVCPSTVTCRSCIASSSADLRLGRGPVDLVGQEQLGEHRAAAELECAPPAGRSRKLPVMSLGSRSGVNWIRLNAEVQALGDEPGDERLGEPGIVLDQDVPVGEDAGQDLPEDVDLAHDHLAERGEDVLTAVGHRLELHGRSSMRATRRSMIGSEGPRRVGPRGSAGRGRSGPASAASLGHSTTSK